MSRLRGVLRVIRGGFTFSVSYYKDPGSSNIRQVVFTRL